MFWILVAILHSAIALAVPDKGSISTTIHRGNEPRKHSPACSPLPASAIPLDIPASAPKNAIQVPPDFLSFGFETAFFPNYIAGTFSENLISSIAKRLPAPLTIRIGGTTGDRVPINANQQDASICVKGDCPVGSDATYSIGSSHFEAFKRFRGQKMTFQAPMGPDVNEKTSLEYVKRAYAALGPKRVAGIALGNEINLYNSQYHVPYTLADYVADAKSLQHSIVSALNLPMDKRIFETLDLASAGKGFSAHAAWAANIDAAGLVKSAATHWYQFPISESSDYSPASMQKRLMNHSAIAAKFAAGYAQDLAFLAAHAPEVEYVLSETGSSLIGPPLRFQDSFGAALWAVDFNLYAMSMGVSRVVASQRPAAHHSLWVPDASANSKDLGAECNAGPQVRGPWFAMPMLADFIGKNPGRVVRLVEEDDVVVYGMFGPGEKKLDKIAVLNMRFWAQETGGLHGGKERGHVTFSIPVADLSVKKVTVKRLQADAGAHALGYDAGGKEEMITWAGETWSHAKDKGHGHFVEDVPRSQAVEVCEGIALVSVKDTSAAIISFHC